MIRKENGFTLVELMVALALTGIVTVAIYKTFTWQQRVYTVQDSVASMQQGLRAGMDILLKDLRMAGYSPVTPGLAGITAASGNSMTFTIDRDSNGISNGTIDPGETISYSVNSSGNLTRTVSGSPAVVDVVMDNVDTLDFVYYGSNWAPLGATPADFTKIRAVRVTIVARTDKKDQAYTNTSSYYRQPDPNAAPGTAGAVILAGSGEYRRRVLSTTVTFRNLGAW